MVQLSGATYNSADFENFGHAEKTVAGSDGQVRQRWENLMVDAKAEMATSVSAAASQQQQASASATATAADRQAVAIDRAAVATDRSTTQNLVTQAQSSQTASAASAVLAQQFIGTATNTIVPAVNYRLASAWDANGQPTAYTLTGVVAVHRYDTRLDWDRGAWRKGKLARASSWYNETLNTATRGAKKEFPVVALIVVLSTGQSIIYDALDLDANVSPRMWWVQNAAVGWKSPSSTTSIGARGGLIVIGGAGIEIFDFVADRQRGVNTTGPFVRMGRLADRNTAATGYASQVTGNGLVNSTVNGVDLRVLPGAPLDPMSRMPIPTIAVATAGGASVIHPTGLIANITGFAPTRANLLPDGRLMLLDPGAGPRIGPVPYASTTLGSWSARVYLNTTAPQTSSGVIQTALAGMGLICEGRSGGLAIIAEDAANPANGMSAVITKEYATGWMPGDCRMATLCEGAGINGASGGNLFTAGSNGAMDSTAGFSPVNATLASVSGELQVTSSSTSVAIADSTYTVTAGVPLTVEVTYRRGTSGGNVFMQVTDGTSGSAVLAGTQSSSTSNVTDRVTIVPTGTQITVRLYHSPTAAGQTAFFDNVSVRKTGTFSDVITGTAELIVNGDGSTTTGWTGGNAGTLSSVSGRLRVTGTGTDQACAYQTIATKAGETYQIKADVVLGTATTWAIIVYNGVGLGGAGLFSTGYVNSSVTGGIYSFTATGSATTLAFINGGTTNGQYTDFDNLSCKSCVPDRSCKGKGLIPVGTLNRSPVATGSDLYAVSGFSAANYLEQPYNPDMDVGTGDCAWAMWFNGAMSLMRAYYTGAAFSGTSVRLINTGGLIRFFVSDGAVNAQANSNTAYTAGAWHLAVGVLRRATNTAELWVDGVLLASASAAGMGSLNNTSATTRVGKEHDGSVWGEGVALPRFAAYAPTPAQIRRMYADEAALFQPGAKAFLGGSSNSVQSLALDEDTGVLSVGTADGVSQFACLRRVGRLTQAAGTAFTAASVTSLSAGGGALLVGTASEAGIVTELMPVKDELRQAPAASLDVVFDCTTTDAMLTNAGRLFVAEGESLLVDALVEATEYGQTPVEGASFRIAARVRRNLGGNIVLVGSSLRDVVDRTTSTLDANISVDTATQTVLFTVTGKAGTRLNWRIVPRLVWLGETRTAA